MSFKVLIFSRDTIFQIGITLCIKKSYPNVTIYKTSALDQVYVTDKCIDLLVFDDLKLTNLYETKDQFFNILNGRKVVFFTQNMDIENFLDIEDVIYINKDSSESDVVKRLRLLCLKHKLIKHKRINKNILKNNALSKRELQCAKLLMDGNSVSEISKHLSLRMSTVSTYKRRIHIKTNTKNVIQLLRKL